METENAKFKNENKQLVGRVFFRKGAEINVEEFFRGI